MVDDFQQKFSSSDVFIWYVKMLYFYRIYDFYFAITSTDLTLRQHGSEITNDIFEQKKKKIQ